MQSSIVFIARQKMELSRDNIQYQLAPLELSNGLALAFTPLPNFQHGK